MEADDIGVQANEHHAESVEIQSYRRQSFALWQQLARRREQRRNESPGLVVSVLAS